MAENPQEEIVINPEETAKKEKIVIEAGVEFNVASRTIHYIDPKTGKLVAESLQDYSKKLLTKHRSLDEFITAWSEAEKKGCHRQ